MTQNFSQPIAYHLTLENAIQILGLVGQIDGVAYDGWGVLKDEKGMYPGVPEHLARMTGIYGLKTALVSNTSEQHDEARAGYAKQGVDFDVVLTAGGVSRDVLLRRAFAAVADIVEPKYFVLGKNNPSMFAGTGMIQVDRPDDANFVYIGTPEVNGARQLCVDAFKPNLARCLDLGLTLFSPNPDHYAPSGPQMLACQGLVAHTFEQMGGQVVMGGGKPLRGIFDECMQRMGITDPSRLLFVGDSPGFDIKGARGVGMRPVLVIGGGIARMTMDKDRQTLHQVCGQAGAFPDFAIDGI